MIFVNLRAKIDRFIHGLLGHKAWCCKIGCWRKAIWQLYSNEENATPDDFTLSCDKHIGYLNSWNHTYLSKIREPFFKEAQ
jgi:hypothetical protein